MQWYSLTIYCITWVAYPLKCLLLLWGERRKAKLGARTLSILHRQSFTSLQFTHKWFMHEKKRKSKREQQNLEDKAPARSYIYICTTSMRNSQHYNSHHLTQLTPSLNMLAFTGHLLGRKPGRTRRAPYLRNPLIAGSTRLRQESPEGGDDWWKGFNNSTNSRGNKKCLQTNVNNNRKQAASICFTLQCTCSRPAFLQFRRLTTLARCSSMLMALFPTSNGETLTDFTIIDWQRFDP